MKLDLKAMNESLPRIFITGFMGAGKTTVASALAVMLGCRALDLDQFITERLGQSPQIIIDESGEARFRELETKALAEALRDEAARVVALGGGTWTVPHNRALIEKGGGLSVWLDAPFELCWRRIESACGTRPLGRSRADALMLFKTRRALYELASVRVQVDETKNADEIAAEIVSRLLPQDADT